MPITAPSPWRPEGKAAGRDRTEHSFARAYKLRDGQSAPSWWQACRVEAAVPIDVGFVVADAEAPRLELRDQSLTLIFVDWKDKDVRAEFSDVIGVRWQEADGHLLPGERDDSVLSD